VTRALVRYERASSDDDWQPMTVFLATPTQVHGRTIPGDPARQAWLAELLSASGSVVLAAATDGEHLTYEGWADWALEELTNVYFTWTVDVEPTATIDELYEREIVARSVEPSVTQIPSRDAERDPDGEPGLPYRVEAADRTDDLLRRYLPTERPAGFDALPRDERAWRGRMFLATWAFTGSAAFAWAAAGVRDPVEVAESRELVAGIPDERIEAELIRTEGRRSEVMFGTLGDG